MGRRSGGGLDGDHSRFSDSTLIRLRSPSRQGFAASTRPPPTSLPKASARLNSEAATRPRGGRNVFAASVKLDILLKNGHGEQSLPVLVGSFSQSEWIHPGVD
jgi:hypothetical protein